MRKVIFSSFNFAPSFVAPAMSLVQWSIDAGDEVHYVTCLKSFSSCGFNSFSYRYMCDLCVHRYKVTSRLVDGNFHLHKLSSMFLPEDFKKARKFVTESGEINKQLWYGMFDVGESVLSSYISKTRDRDLEIRENLAILPELAEQSIVVFEAVRRFLVDHSIEEVLLFNGRWDYYRAVFRAANELGIPCNVFENFRQGGYIELYGNAFPHIILNKQKKYDLYWSREDVSIKEKKEVAQEYFTKKRHGIVVTGKAFTRDQVRSCIPEEIDRDKKMLVLFNSSDDEFAAVAGDEYKNPLFADQVEGIQFVVDLVTIHLPEYNLVIRMHPNLKGVGFQYVQPIYDLKGKYRNVFVIEPDSKVDSYALMDAADKVITFGSSIGVEANYWRKPVILLGKPFYFYSDLAYVPKDRSEILALLGADSLEPKPIENSEKIGYYTMRGGVKAPHYHYTVSNGRTHYFKDVRLDRISFLRRVYYKIMKALKVKNSRKHVQHLNQLRRRHVDI